ncbi:MAG: c-type cytochrome [Geminicoccaceae bacterium]
MVRRRRRAKSRYHWLFGSALILVVAGTSAWLVTGGTKTSPDILSDADYIATGQVFYDEYCARCHGADLKGEFGWMADDQGISDAEREVVEKVFDDLAPAHDASGQTSRHSDETLFKIIKWGPERALGQANSRMPGSGQTLADDEIWAIIAFLKSHWPDEPRPEDEAVQTQ